MPYFKRFSLVLCLYSTLSGCAATQQEVAARLGQQYIGQNVDNLVRRFGPPASSFRMNSGEMAYNWNLTAVTSMSVSSNQYGSHGSAQTEHCRVRVTAAPNGTITSLDTEDASGTGGLVGALGVDIYGSICAQHLGIPRDRPT